MNNQRRLCLALGAASLLVAAILCGIVFARRQAPAKLEWNRPTVKKTIQTYAYKIYGNPSLQHGRYFMSKTVFRNSGGQPIKDFSVSYRIHDYIDWTTPETLMQIPPGETVVKLFYPHFPNKVAEIRNMTPSMLETRVRWSDGSGPPHEEVIQENFQFRGVNEVEYTDLPATEILGWHDQLRECNLEAAMVTPNDPVVAEYAAAVTESIGGAVAGAGGDKDKIEVMSAIYNYMMATGMCYAGDGGDMQAIGDIHTMVQTVRMPRDVILSNNGLCIELTLVWASLLEHLGIDSLVFNIPGHAFIVVPIEGSIDGLSYVPIECTAITPKAVGKKKKGPIGFEEAYSLAAGELRDAINAGQYIAYNPHKLHIEGIEAPELPGINIEEVKRIIYSRQPRVIRASATNR